MRDLVPGRHAKFNEATLYAQGMLAEIVVAGERLLIRLKLYKSHLLIPDKQKIRNESKLPANV